MWWLLFIMEPSACSFRPLDATEEEETIWQLDGTLVRMAGCTEKPTHTHEYIYIASRTYEGKWGIAN
jgi:hypothetical protein